MFNMDSRQMKKAMQQMGIQSEEVDAEEVIIKTGDKEIVVSNPQVTKIMMQGQATFQVAGEVSEREKEMFSEEDVKTIVDQTGVNEEDAKAALKETGDLAEAIMKLKE